MEHIPPPFSPTSLPPGRTSMPHYSFKDAHWEPERRKDDAMADLVDVGLLFVRVFGRDRGFAYFQCTVVEPHVYRRVLLGRHRGFDEQDQTTDSFL